MKAIDKAIKACDAEKYFATMKNASGKEVNTTGYSISAIREWIKFHEEKGYKLVKKNFDNAIKACDASEIHILFYRDIDGNKIAEKFSDIGKMRSRAEELVSHGVDRKKMKEWTHAEWAKEKYNEIFNKLMGQI